MIDTEYLKIECFIFYFEIFLIRLVTIFLNGSVYNLQEGFRITAGAVFSLGFLPMHGGPFRYVNTMGAQKVFDAMRKFENA